MERRSPGKECADFGVVLLCAEAAPRRGGHRGLVHRRGGTPIEQAARTAIASGAAEVVVVLGDSSRELRARLGGLRVRIVASENPDEGIAASIRAGVAALSPEIGGAVVTLVDQVRVTSAHLRALAAGLDRETIVASRYAGVVGAPCAFARSEFGRLLALRGPQGARALLRDPARPIATIAFEAAAIEIELPSLPIVIAPAPVVDATCPSIRTYASRAPPYAPIAL